MPVPIAMTLPENQWPSHAFSEMIDRTVNNTIREFGLDAEDTAMRARLALHAVDQITEYAGPAGNA